MKQKPFIQKRQCFRSLLFIENEKGAKTKCRVVMLILYK
jgi:hypothetical protein